MLPELGTFNSLLPTEVVNLIIKDFISEHADKIPKLEPPIFLPQWYLVPLLRVCRMWLAITEKYLYRSIAIGSHMHHQSPVIEGETQYDIVVRVQKLQRTQPKRSGQKIAENLLASLEMNTRLASLVETLWLRLETVE